MKDISIVIPIYNEEKLIVSEVEKIRQEMKQKIPHKTYEIFLVENGSKDRTKELIRELVKKYDEVRAINQPVADYGQALKECVIQSNGSQIVVFNIDFWDFDFATKALSYIEQGSDLVIGSKAMKGAGDKRPFFRRMVTKSFNIVLRLFFGFSGTDTHGLKAMKRDTMMKIFRDCETDGLIFDTEFVLRAQFSGLTLREIPVICEEKRETRLNIGKSVVKTLEDLTLLLCVLRKKQLEKFINWVFIASIIVFIGSIAWGFPDSPSPWFDEGVNLGIAKTFVEDGVYSLRTSPGNFVQERGLMISTNYPLLFPLATSFKLFGVGLAQAKVVMIIFLILFLIVAFNLIKKQSNRLTAISTMALIVVFLPFYGNGLSGGIGEVTGLLFFLLAISQLNTKIPKRQFLAGILFGLCASTKVFYLVVLGALLVSEFVFAVKERSIPLKRWIAMGLGILIPLSIWIKTLIPNFTSLRQFDLVKKYYANPYQVENTFVENVFRFVTESTPIHFLVLAVPVFIYLYKIYKKNNDFSRQAVLIITFIILNLLYYLKTPGWYRYFFPSHLLLLTLFPLAVVSLSKNIKKKWLVLFFPIITISSLVFIQSFHFISGRNTRLYYNPVPRQFIEHLSSVVSVEDTLHFIDQPVLWFLYEGKSSSQYL